MGSEKNWEPKRSGFAPPPRVGCSKLGENKGDTDLADGQLVEHRGGANFPEGQNDGNIYKGANLQWKDNSPPPGVFAKVRAFEQNKITFKKTGIGTRKKTNCGPKTNVILPAQTDSNEKNIAQGVECPNLNHEPLGQRHRAGSDWGAGGRSRAQKGTSPRGQANRGQSDGTELRSGARIWIPSQQMENKR